MKNTGFDKALFKNAVIFNVKNMFRRTIDEATPQQIFQAVAYTVKDDIIDQWITDQNFSRNSKIYSVTWESYDPDTGELGGTYKIDQTFGGGESPAKGTLDLENGTMKFRFTEPITAHNSVYEQETFNCHIDPLYATFVDEDGYVWCPASKDEEE